MDSDYELKRQIHDLRWDLERVTSSHAELDRQLRDLRRSNADLEWRLREVQWRVDSPTPATWDPADWLFVPIALIGMFVALLAGR
jgi:hypothetical protein